MAGKKETLHSIDVRCLSCGECSWMMMHDFANVAFVPHTPTPRLPQHRRSGWLGVKQQLSIYPTQERFCLSPGAAHTTWTTWAPRWPSRPTMWTSPTWAGCWRNCRSTRCWTRGPPTSGGSSHTPASCRPWGPTWAISLGPSSRLGRQPIRMRTLWLRRVCVDPCRCPSSLLSDQWGLEPAGVFWPERTCV